MYFMKVDKLLILIFVVSFIIRALWVGNHIGQDEVYYVGYTSDLIHGRSFSNVFPPFFEFFLSPFMLAVGESVVPIHLFMAFLGSLTIAVVYLIGKKFLNKWAGLVAALLLAFNTTHWFFSDFGMLDVPAVLFATAGLYFLWSGYKEKSDRKLLAGSLLTIMAVGTRYSFFPSVALIGYLILFDRKNLKNKKLMLALIIPLIIFAIWMYYYMTGMTWLWNWWQNYLTGKLDINIPFYQYLANVYDEFLLPMLSLFVIFTSGFLLARRYFKIKEEFNLVFLLLFVASYFLISQLGYIQTEIRAVIGFVTLLMLSLYYFKGKDFNKFLIIYIALIFLYYSPLSVKFPRYVMVALPALYLLVGEMVYEIRKYKIYFFVGIAVIVFFMAFNAVDTVNKLVTDSSINDVKFEAQQYVIANSQQCSTVFSKTWYSLYYLRLRVSDLPGDLSGFSSAVKSKCSCPPKYVFSEGGSYPSYLKSILVKEKEFSKTYSTTRIDFSGIRSEESTISPVVIYRINEDFVEQLCG